MNLQDVLILSQFVRSDGCMIPRRITGLCKMQQKKIGILVAMAQKAGNQKKSYYTKLFRIYKMFSYLI